jgi:hypothetical protein
MNAMEIVVVIVNWHVFLVQDALQLNPDVTFKEATAYWPQVRVFILKAWVVPKLCLSKCGIH